MSNIFYQIPNNSSTIGYTPLALKYNRRRLSQLIHCHEDTYLSRRERMVSHCFPHHLARTTFSILLLVTSHFPLPVQYGQNFSLQINQPHLKKKKKCFIDRRVSYKDKSGNVIMSTWIDGTERRLSGLFIQSVVIKLTVAVLNMEWKE